MQAIEYIKQILKLTRIEHSLMLIIAVISSEIIVLRHLPNISLVLISFIAPIFISMAAFAINDYFDVETDKKNKQNRPIVVGKIRKEDALNVAIVCFVIGIASAFFINANAFAIAVIFGIISIIYSYKLKDIFLIGNIFVALSMAIPFIYGNYVVSNSISANIILISILILFAGTAREVHGTIRDYEGDKKIRKTRNIVNKFGYMNATIFAVILYLIAIGISIYFFFFNLPFKFNLLYLLLISITDILLIYGNIVYIKIGFKIKNKGNKQNIAKILEKYNLVRNLGLGAMSIALISFIISSLIYVPI